MACRIVSENTSFGGILLYAATSGDNASQRLTVERERLLKPIYFGVGLMVHVVAATAQPSYPDKAVRILVGFPPGGGPDITARALAQRFAVAWDKPVIVENLPGAGGNVAAERVARASPDGHTLLMAVSSGIVINPSLYPKLGFDPVRDLAPISQVAMTASVLTVANEVPVRSVQELVALARAQPGRLTFASAGNGSSQHLAGEAFKSMAQIDIVHVPYKGGPAALPDLIAGRVTMFFGVISSTMPMVQQGKLRALAVTSSMRAATVPQLPTMAESGFAGFDVTIWFGLFAPAATPAAVVRQLQQQTVNALAEPAVRARLADVGMEVIGSSPDELRQVIKVETPKWAKLIKDSGAKPD